MKAQIDALTGIRGIAAWLVVLYHIRLAFAPGLPDWVVAAAAKGYLAVDLFFVLSGFVLWMTWGARLQRERWHAAPAFLRKRIARVWPLHAVILTATVGWALAIQATGRPLPAQYRWDELPLHVVLVQNWGFTTDLAWNDPSWSISTELAAYIAFATLVPLLPRPRGVLWPLTAIAVLIVALDRMFALHGEALLGADIARLGLARCLAQFGCGVAACMVWQAADGLRLRSACGAILVGAAALWLSGLVRETVAVPLLFSALVMLVASTSGITGSPLSSRLAVHLGDISYSTYLAHFLLWIVFKLVFVRDATDVPFALGVLFLLLTYLASLALYHLVEVPARDRLGATPQPPQGNPAPA